MIVSPLAAIAVSALIAPRIQLFTNLVCKELDSRQWDPATSLHVGFVGTTRPVPCKEGPAVQAKVAELLAGTCYSALVRLFARFVPHTPHHALLVIATVQGVLSCFTATFWGSVRATPTLIVVHLA